MSVKTQGKKNFSYYNFLKSIGEENLPIFTERQAEFANYLSGFLPLVRTHELEHALTYLKIVKQDGEMLCLDVEPDDQFVEYILDLIEYGLVRYVIDHGDETGFKLWQNYRMDQVQLKLLKNPANNQV